MEHRSNTNPNPSGIWQASWADLFYRIIEDMRLREYPLAWRNMKLLKVMLPPDCETDVNQEFIEAEKKLNVSFGGGKVITSYAEQALRKYMNTTGDTTLMELLTNIKRSLFTRGWINKDFSAQPKFERKGHL